MEEGGCVSTYVAGVMKLMMQVKWRYLAM